MSRGQYFGLVAVLAGVLVLLGWNAPLSQGLSIGGDDAMELGKAQLLARQPQLADRLHNDQPWLVTLVVAQAFRLLGEDAALARGLTMALSFGLVLACWHLMGKGGSMLEGLLFLAVLLTGREMPTLVTSAMLEPAAMALGVMAVACSYDWRRPVAPWRAYVSGLVMAAAAWAKLTAVLVGPAWVSLLWLQRRSTPLSRVIFRAGLGFAVGLALLASLSPTVSWQSLWLSHWKAHQLLSRTPCGCGFRIEDVFHEWTILVAVGLGVLRLCVRRSPAEHSTVFGLVWLGTAFAVHVWHRPWWGYYAIHFHIPLALVAAQGAGWVIRKAWQELGARPGPETIPEPSGRPGARSRWTQKLGPEAAAVAAAVVISCWCGIRLPLFWQELNQIRTTETAADNPFLPVIRKYAARARWIYCSPNRLAFHTGVLQPPELVIRTYKRLLTGDLSQEKTLAILQAYQPELVLVPRAGELQDSRFVAWLRQGSYVRTMWSQNEELWVAPQLNPPEAKTPDELVRTLKL